MKTLLAIAAIFVLTGLGWFAWLNIDQEGYNSGILDNPPVIKAVDKNKIKYKPPVSNLNHLSCENSLKKICIIHFCLLLKNSFIN